MKEYAVELRTVYGKPEWWVLDVTYTVTWRIARCESLDDATLVCNALTAQNAQECAN